MQLNRHTRYRPRDQPLPHETLPRSGRATRWTNTPVRIFKDPAPTPIPAMLHLWLSFFLVTGKKTLRGAGTSHGTHTGHTGAHGHTDHTDESHNHPNPTTHPHDHATGQAADGRNRGRLNSRRPGADRSPRPTQKRLPPANPTLPPPAPRAPPRACSKAVGEMKARAAVTPYTAAPSSRRLEALQSPPLLFVVLPTPPEPSWSLCGIPGAITSLIKGRLPGAPGSAAGLPSVGKRKGPKRFFYGDLQRPSYSPRSHCGPGRAAAACTGPRSCGPQRAK